MTKLKTTRTIQSSAVETFTIDELKDEKISKSNQLVAILAEVFGVEKPYSQFKTDSGEVRYYIAGDVVDKIKSELFE